MYSNTKIVQMHQIKCGSVEIFLCAFELLAAALGPIACPSRNHSNICIISISGLGQVKTVYGPSVAARTGYEAERCS